MSSNSERILPAGRRLTASSTHLFTSTTTRMLEAAGATQSPHTALMQKAGLALARLALATAPHAQIYWIACGPGNNGGDGFAAAYFLRQWGKTPIISYLQNPTQPADALAARLQAQLLHIDIRTEEPPQFDAAIDCLFGIGSLRTFNAIHTQWISTINRAAVPVIAADVPSGLNGDTGLAAATCVKADYTLSLLTLKPGLFTGDGRETSGEIWFNDLGVDCTAAPAAELLGPVPIASRAHNTHKGTFGDVAVIGGASGMTGAALLAATAALHAGAGRVFVGLLQDPPVAWDTSHPELMFKPPQQLALEKMTVVAGCGGADAIASSLQEIIERAGRLVLDADALNHIAGSPALRKLLSHRPSASTVLTPHPLEAARLLTCSTTHIQSDRLLAAQSLADRFNATTVLKGSGTIVATPGCIPAINTSGNGLLATAGTGDVLAGLIGAKLAHGLSARQAACEAVYHHGAVADRWDLQSAGALTAGGLSRNL